MGWRLGGLFAPNSGDWDRTERNQHVESSKAKIKAQQKGGSNGSKTEDKKPSEAPQNAESDWW